MLGGWAYGAIYRDSNERTAAIESLLLVVQVFSLRGFAFEPGEEAPVDSSCLPFSAVTL
jgi:hypothetical protein